MMSYRRLSFFNSCLLPWAFLCTFVPTSAQVKISETGASPAPHPSAALEIDFSNRGFLLPRLTTIERTAINNPSMGLFIFNTDINCLEFYNGTFWQILCGFEAVCSNPPASPTMNAATSFSTSQFTVNWNSAPGADTYLVQASLNSNFSSFVLNQSVSNTNSAEVQGLSAGDLCYYRVAALNACGTSPFSAVQSVVIPDGQVQGLITVAPYNVSGTSAWSGGSYSGDGGIVPSVRGVCWSINSPPTTADFVASNGSGSGDFLTAMTSLAPSTTYYVRAFVTNTAGTFYGNEEVFVTLEWAPQIGEYHEGGHIFYIDEGIGYGLIISPENQAWYSAQWGCPGLFIEGASEEAAGSGVTNTANIVAQCGEDNVAARICADHSESGYSDWFLPSKDEFQLAWENVTPLGLGVDPDTYQYWTSTQANEWEAWFFGTGGLGWWYGWKGDGGRSVRCIRSFCTAAPAVPDILEPDNFSLTQFQANWAGVAGASAFILQASLQSDFGTLILNQNVGNSTSEIIEGLSVGDVCYYRVSAINSCGNSPFSSAQSAVIPDGQVQGIVTEVPTDIAGNQAAAGGSYSSDGGIAPTDRGVCWSTSPSPTMDDSFTSGGPGSGSFSVLMTGLTPLTTYYIRAYVSNASGTYYGNEVSFATTSILYFTGEGLNTWVVPDGVSEITLTVVGGGGGGGADVGGGGGGGQVINISSYAVSAGQVLSITVAARTDYPAGYNFYGKNGGTTTVTGGLGGTITALGGNGGRGRSSGGPGSNIGWNGGGGSYDYPTGNTGNGGYQGGNAYPGRSCGGGGGSGSSGQNATLNSPGNGGAGLQSIIDGVFYGGGGGGGEYDGNTTGLGTHGGGNGGRSNDYIVGQDGIPNRGGGGGGGPSTGEDPNAGRGSSGIVILSY